MEIIHGRYQRREFECWSIGKSSLGQKNYMISPDMRFGSFSPLNCNYCFNTIPQHIDTSASSYQEFTNSVAVEFGFLSSQLPSSRVGKNVLKVCQVVQERDGVRLTISVKFWA